MIFKIHLYSRFFLSEIFSLKSKSFFIINFFKQISIIKLIIFYITKKNYPFRNNDINEYLKKNNQIWKNEKINSKKKIIIDLTLNAHPLYSIGNWLIAKDLSKFYKTNNIVCLINRYDYLSYFISLSFGVKNFHYADNNSFVSRLFYFFKATNLIEEKNIKKKLIKLKYKKILIGKAAYEYTIRNFTKDIFSKKENYLFYISISRAIYSVENHEKFFNQNISAFVIGEIQYIPNRIFYEYATKYKIPIQTRIGGNTTDDFTVRSYRKAKDRFSPRDKISKKLALFLRKNSDFNFKKKVNKYFLKASSPSSKQIGLDKMQTENGHIKKQKVIQFKDNLSFNNYFNLSDKNKNILILPHVISDNSFDSEWNLFFTPLDWFIKTLYRLKRIKNVNWIIKPHPSEKMYSPTISVKKFYDETIKSKHKNVKFINENITIKDLQKHVDCIITSSGSAGFHYSSLGLPVITTADAPYSNFNFTYAPKNKNDYYHLIENLHKIKKLNKDKIYMAKLYWYTFKKIIRSKNNLLPLFDTHHNYDQKKFWKHANSINLVKNKIKNPFSKDFKIQLNNNNRHTINFSPINGKNYNNVKLNDI